MQRSWYYSKDRTERQGPGSTDELRELLRRGLLPADALVWREGMSDWTPASEQAELSATASEDIAASATPPPPPTTATSTTPAQPAATPQPPVAGTIPTSFGGWLRFVGIASIVMGTLYCASCFGILWGVLLIIGGVSLLGARTALNNVSEVPPAFIPFLHKLNTFFVVMGVAYILMLAGAALVLIFYGGFMIAALSSLG